MECCGPEVEPKCLFFPQQQLLFVEKEPKGPLDQRGEVSERYQSTGVVDQLIWAEERQPDGLHFLVVDQ